MRETRRVTMSRTTKGNLRMWLPDIILRVLTAASGVDRKATTPHPLDHGGPGHQDDARAGRAREVKEGHLLGGSLSSSVSMFAAIGMRIHTHRTFEQPVAKSRNYRNLWLFRYLRAATIAICGAFPSARRRIYRILRCFCNVRRHAFAIEEPKLSHFALLS